MHTRTGLDSCPAVATEAWTLKTLKAVSCRANNPGRITPFGEAARQAGYSSMQMGGKVDDITVIVSYVHEDASKL